MPCVKTAISIEESLFKEVEALARELKVSRSQVFSMGARRLLERHRRDELVRRINEAYAEPMDEEEQAFIRASMASVAELNKDDKW